MAWEIASDSQSRCARVFKGNLIVPSDSRYDAARKVFNAAIDKYPALIAQCADACDVARALGLARERGLVVAVRGGGHSVAGHSVCDGGVVIDLSLMNTVHVDPVCRTACAGPGVTWAELDTATQQY